MSRMKRALPILSLRAPVTKPYYLIPSDGSIPATSAEHDDQIWLSPYEARRLVVWPAYLTAIERIEAMVADRQREPWFRLRLDGSRMVD